MKPTINVGESNSTFAACIFFVKEKIQVLLIKCIDSLIIIINVITSGTAGVLAVNKHNVNTIAGRKDISSDSRGATITHQSGRGLWYFLSPYF